MHKFISACGCNIGRVRSNNEDNFCFNGFVLSAENCGLRDVLFASGTLDKAFCIGVFDGMGGEAFGEEASYIAAKVLKEKHAACNGTPTKVLLDACNEANDQICAEARKRAVGVIGAMEAFLRSRENETNYQYSFGPVSGDGAMRLRAECGRTLAGAIRFRCAVLIRGKLRGGHPCI